MKPSDPLLHADVALRFGMYPAGKVDISQHLATPGFPQSDHTVGEPSADAGSLCSETLQTSWPQVIFKCQPLFCLDYRSTQTDPGICKRFESVKQSGISLKIHHAMEKNALELCFHV